MLKSTVVLFLLLIAFTSCNKTKDVSAKVQVAQSSTNEAAVNLKKVSLDIDGMTCEIGCARTIQSKLSKTEGIKLATVNFSEKKGTVEYDSNKISEKEIVATVEKIAGGDLYKVSKTTEVE